MVIFLHRPFWDLPLAPRKDPVLPCLWEELPPSLITRLSRLLLVQGWGLFHFTLPGLHKEHTLGLSASLEHKCPKERHSQDSTWGRKLYWALIPVWWMIAETMFSPKSLRFWVIDTGYHRLPQMGPSKRGELGETEGITWERKRLKVLCSFSDICWVPVLPAHQASSSDADG